MLAAARPAWPALLAGLLLGPATAAAYGPAGHIAAGAAAEPLLCARARDGIEALAGRVDLAELGRWADTIRSNPRYEASAPWHYMNVPDDGSIQAHAHPPEGDVLEAIARFRERLGDPGRSAAERLEALRFLTHFVVDIHQPLHVGRASDRGGNTIDVRFAGETTNLHRFWDSGALARADGGLGAYIERLVPLAARLHAGFAPERPARWAEESFMLRAWVYSYEAGGEIELSPAYVRRAESLTEMRLARAAARLAATLNAVFCPSRQ